MKRNCFTQEHSTMIQRANQFVLPSKYVYRLEAVLEERGEEQKVKHWKNRTARIQELMNDCDDKLADLKSKGDPKDRRDVEEQIFLAKVLKLPKISCFFPLLILVDFIIEVYVQLSSLQSSCFFIFSSHSFTCFHYRNVNTNCKHRSPRLMTALHMEENF